MQVDTGEFQALRAEVTEIRAELKRVSTWAQEALKTAIALDIIEQTAPEMPRAAKPHHTRPSYLRPVS